MIASGVSSLANTCGTDGKYSSDVWCARIAFKDSRDAACACRAMAANLFLLELELDKDVEEAALLRMMDLVARLKYLLAVLVDGVVFLVLFTLLTCIGTLFLMEDEDRSSVGVERRPALVLLWLALLSLLFSSRGSFAADGKSNDLDDVTGVMEGGFLVGVREEEEEEEEEEKGKLWSPPSSLTLKLFKTASSLEGAREEEKGKLWSPPSSLTLEPLKKASASSFRSSLAPFGPPLVIKSGRLLWPSRVALIFSCCWTCVLPLLLISISLDDCIAGIKLCFV